MPSKETTSLQLFSILLVFAVMALSGPLFLPLAAFLGLFSWLVKSGKN